MSADALPVSLSGYACLEVQIAAEFSGFRIGQWVHLADGTPAELRAFTCRSYKPSALLVYGKHRWPVFATLESLRP